MKLLNWAETFETGNKTIDEQHIGLMSSINDMYALAKEKKGQAVFAKCCELEKKLVTHLRDEEEILSKANFPRTEQHQNTHEQAIHDFRYSNTKCGQTCLTDCMVPCLPELAALLVQHIVRDDTDFISHLQTTELSDRKH